MHGVKTANEATGGPPSGSFVRLEIDLPEEAANRFAFLLAELNSRPGSKFTPSELACSILCEVLEDDHAAHRPVDLRALDA